MSKKTQAQLEELKRLGCQDADHDNPKCLDPETGEFNCDTCDHENPRPDRPLGPTKVTCRLCGRRVILAPAGHLLYHRTPDSSSVCPASSKPPPKEGS